MSPPELLELSYLIYSLEMNFASEDSCASVAARFQVVFCPPEPERLMDVLRRQR
jgi:hypothetical protein